IHTVTYLSRLSNGTVDRHQQLPTSLARPTDVSEHRRIETDRLLPSAIQQSTYRNAPLHDY
ncbi:MAG: hypothetical protein ABI142_04320, partial [Bryocella sp.]